jgi:hypothetical protein
MKSTGTHLGIGLRAIVVLAMASCVVQVGFDPTEGPVEVTGQWTVSGQVPDVVACGPIDTVRLVICDAINTSCYDDPTGRFEFPCESGGFSDPTALLHGRYAIHWEAFDSAGRRIAESAPMIFDVSMPSVTFATLPTIDFILPSSLSFELFWDTGAGYGTCDDAIVDGGITWSLVLNGNVGAPIATYAGPCVDAIDRTDAPVGALPPGTYDLIVSGSATDSTSWSGTCAGIVLVQGAQLLVDCDIDIL